MNLRPYQEEAMEAALEVWQEHASTLIVLPTGTGKTIVFAHIIDRLPAGRRALVLAHRDKLVWQAAEKIERVTGVKPDVEMADYRAHERGLIAHKAPVIVSTIQTQISGRNGSRRMHRFDPHEFGLLVVDEAHHAVSRSYREVLEYYRRNPDLKVLGVTATPDRKDEAALGHVFDSCAFDYEIIDAIQDGWLVPVRQRAVVIEGLDYSRVHTTAGDLNEAELSELLRTEGPVQGMVSATVEIANGLHKGTCKRLLETERKGDDPAPVALAAMLDGGEDGTLFTGGVRRRRALVFCVTVAHAERFTEILNRWIPESARIVHGRTPKDERRSLYRDYTHGRFQFLCNVGVATEGFDEPGIELVVMARPTKSRALYAQMAGRGTRPLDKLAMRLNDLSDAEGRRDLITASHKPFVEILDFVGNAGRHHLITGADILGGRHPDEVIRRAREAAEKAGKPVDIVEELAKAEAAIKREAEEEAERRRRRHVRMSADYKTKEVSPWTLWDIQPRRERGWDAAKESTAKQRVFLKKQGIDTHGLSRGQASQLCGKVIKRFKGDRCTYKQAKTLARFGYDPDVSFADAREIIDRIAANGWRRPDPQPATAGVDVDAIPL